MKVGLVIVTYNNPEAIQKHLSVLRTQTRKPDGIVIVNNGGSIDEVLQEYKDFRIDVIAFDNIGPAGGFKEGQKKAYADGYDIIIMADDDAWPADKETIARLAGAVEGGELVVGAWDTDGNPASCSNHYHAIHRSMFEKAGFYFAPLFMMMEDTEFPNRVREFAEVQFLKDAPVFHPHTPVISPMRAYLTYRNRQVLNMIHGRWLDFSTSFCYYLFRSLFMWFYLRDFDYVKSYVKANLALIKGRLGKPDVVNRRTRGKKVDKAADEKNTVFISVGPMAIEPPSEDMTVVRESRGAIGNMMDFSGKDLMVAFPMSMGYPPHAMLSRDIYWYDARTKETEFIFRNNPLITALIGLFALDMGLSLLPFALLFYIIKKGFYRKLREKEIEKDLEFCRSG